MANEFLVRSGLQVKSGNVSYSRNKTFRASLRADDVLGPTPGMMTISTAGEDISFAELGNPGLIWIENYDANNYIEYGLHDGTIFHYWGEVLPGEAFPIRLSRNFGEEAVAAGTGTSAVVNTFFVRANTAACRVLIEAFEA